MTARPDSTGWLLSQFPPFPDSKIVKPGLMYEYDGFTLHVPQNISVVTSWPFVGPTPFLGPPLIPIIPYPWGYSNKESGTIWIDFEFANEQDTASLDLSELRITTSSRGTFTPHFFYRTLDSSEWIMDSGSIATDTHKFLKYYFAKNYCDTHASPSVRISLPQKYFSIGFNLNRQTVADSIDTFRIVFPVIRSNNRSFSLPVLNFVKKSRYKYYALFVG